MGRQVHLYPLAAESLWEHPEEAVYINWELFLALGPSGYLVGTLISELNPPKLWEKGVLEPGPVAQAYNPS